MYFAYSADPRMRINVGIRRRLAPLVDNNRRRIELLNSLLLSFPGTPILYYGDEIGMGDNIYLGDRNGVRTPMQWNSDRNAGFSTRRSRRDSTSPSSWTPSGATRSINVEAQQSDQSSPAALDAQHDRAAQALPGLRPRHAGVSQPGQPQDPRLPSPLRRKTATAKPSSASPISPASRNPSRSTSPASPA